MSKFFDDTQKTEHTTTRTLGTGRYDIGSLVEAMKQGDMPEPAPAPQLRHARLRQVDVSKGVAQLPVNLTGEEPVAVRALEAYRSLRTRVMKMQVANHIRSIMITSSIPNEGKTITSLNLAICCAQLEETRILLVDSDLRSRGLTRLLQTAEQVGLSDMLAGKATIDDALQGTDRSNLFFLAAGSPKCQPAELFAGPRWPEFVAWANDAFDLTLIDGPPIFSFTDAELIVAGCDGALMVVKAFSTPRDMAQKCVGRLPKKKFLGAVFNGVPDGPESRYGYYGYYSETNGKSQR